MGIRDLCAVRFIAISFGLVIWTNVSHALVDGLDPFVPQLIPVELQAWWQPDFGHIHAGTRLPVGQQVSGRLEFDVRIVLHDNPSHLTNLRIDTDKGIYTSIPLGLDCPYDGVNSSTCAFNVPVSLDTTQLPDGWRELRLRATTETPDAKSYLNSSAIMLNVQNGGPSDDVGFNNWCDYQSLVGRGWYDTFEYTNAVIECVPQAPISGTHTFRVRAQEPSQRLVVALDRTHFIPAVGPWPDQEANPGQILFDEDGDFQSFNPITIDTTTLSDGWHTLAVTSTGPSGDSSQCAYCLPTTVNVPSGAAKIWFYVQNSAPTNQPPYVDAGDDQAILLGSAAELAPTVYDDGLPSASETIDWWVESGPGTVTFADPSAAQTTASFSDLGVYVLRLDVADGAYVTSDTVTVVVNSIIHAEAQSGGSAESSSVATAGPLSGLNGFHVASIATKPRVSVTGVSGLGLTWTLLREQCAGRNQTGVSLWYADGSPASAGTVQASLGSAPRNAVIAVSRYTGTVTLGQVLSGNSVGSDGACSGGVDSGEYRFDVPPATSSDTLVFSATATRQTAHAPGLLYSTRETLIFGSSGAAAGVATQDRPAFQGEATAVDGTFGWETDWAVVAVELRGDAAPPPPPNVDPLSAFSYACDDLDCAFTDASSDEDGVIEAWSWDFGAGQTSSAQHPSHSYGLAGSYPVTLIVTDDDNATGSMTQTVSVTAASQPPAAPTNLMAAIERTGKGRNKVVTGVTLSWTDNAVDEDNFVVERCEETGRGRNKVCVYVEIASLPPDTTSFTDDTPPEGSTLKYRVKARNAYGDSAHSNEAKI